MTIVYLTFCVCTALAPLRRPILARQRDGDLVNRVPVVCGWDGQHIRPRIVGPGGRADLRFRSAAVLRGRVACWLRDVGHRRRGHTRDHGSADGIHTGIAVLPHDGRQTGRGGPVVEEVAELRKRRVRGRAWDRQAVRHRRQVMSNRSNYIITMIILLLFACKRCRHIFSSKMI